MDQLGDSQAKSKKRERTKSDFFEGSEVCLEDLTVMKLMEEIMEIDQEIKMKQKFIKTRMTMLSKLLPSHPNKKTAIAAEDFMLKIKSQYTNSNNQVTYEEPAIPMRQADVFAEPISMK